MAVAGKSDPCLSAQTREEPMDCPQASSLWGKMMERVSPAPLFEDPFLGEGDDEDKVLSAILEDEDDDDEDAILPPIQSRPPSAQDASSPSPVQTDLLKVYRRAVARLSIDWPSQLASQSLCTSRGAIQSCGRSMGLAVVGERSLWLGLSGLSDKEKVEFLDALIDPKAMFGVTVTAMCQQCDLQKKKGEAFEVCLPRKPAAQPYNPSRPKFRTSGRGGHSDFQPSRPAPTQQPGNAGPQSKPGFMKPKQAAKHRSAAPQGNKKSRAT